MDLNCNLALLSACGLSIRTRHPWLLRGSPCTLSATAVLRLRTSSAREASTDRNVSVRRPLREETCCLGLFELRPGPELLPLHAPVRAMRLRSRGEQPISPCRRRTLRGLLLGRLLAPFVGSSIKLFLLDDVGLGLHSWEEGGYYVRIYVSSMLSDCGKTLGMACFSADHGVMQDCDVQHSN